MDDFLLKSQLDMVNEKKKIKIMKKIAKNEQQRYGVGMSKKIGFKKKDLKKLHSRRRMHVSYFSMSLKYNSAALLI